MTAVLEHLWCGKQITLALLAPEVRTKTNKFKSQGQKGRMKIPAQEASTLCDHTTHLWFLPTQQYGAPLGVCCRLFREPMGTCAPPCGRPLLASQASRSADNPTSEEIHNQTPAWA